LQALATELLVVKDRVRTEKEKLILDYSRAALGYYKGSADAWQEILDVQRRDANDFSPPSEKKAILKEQTELRQLQWEGAELYIDEASALLTAPTTRAQVKPTVSKPRKRTGPSER
jgi:hypothetical protein